MTDRSGRTLRVVKFGGSTMGDAERIAEAARRVVAADPRPTAVVVSAPGELTDTILALSSGLGGPDRPAEVARSLALGESLGASLMAAALAAQRVAVRLVLPTDADWPLVTKGDPMEAEIDLERSAPRVLRLLGPGAPITVLPGFVGTDGGTGRITTLGRGGSDTTAVALGRLLGRSEVILVKDVPGVLEADPRLVPEARPLPELSVDEMEALARGGAKVVAASALTYMDESVLLRIISIGHSLDGHEGTVIRAGRRDLPSTDADSHDDPRAGPHGPGWGLVTALPRAQERDPPRDGGTSASIPPPLRLWVRDEEAGRLVQALHGSGALRAIAYRGPLHLPVTAMEEDDRSKGGAR